MSAPAVLVAIPLLVGVVAGALSGGRSRAGLILLAIAGAAAAIGLWRARALLVVAATATGCLAGGAALGSRASQAAAAPSLLTWFHESTSHDNPAHITA